MRDALELGAHGGDVAEDDGLAERGVGEVVGRRAGYGGELARKCE